MSATDVAAELLNSPPRIGQGSADSLSAAKILCIVTIATREIISLLIYLLFCIIMIHYDDNPLVRH
jgi:hypothetical protein